MNEKRQSMTLKLVKERCWREASSMVRILRKTSIYIVIQNIQLKMIYGTWRLPQNKENVALLVVWQDTSVLRLTTEVRFSVCMKFVNYSYKITNTQLIIIIIHRFIWPAIL